MRLSAHFTLRELTRSQLAARRGITNVAGPQTVENLARLCEGVLEPVRAHFGVAFTPSSGYRSAALNRALGSGAASQHITGEAVDFEVPGVANLDLARWIRDALLFDQLIVEYPAPDDPGAGWVHCSLVGPLGAGGNRREVLTRTRSGYRRGLPEETDEINQNR